MWNCPACDEEVRDSFDVCSSCGTTRNDKKDAKSEALEKGGKAGDVMCPFCSMLMQPGTVMGDRYALQWQPANKKMFLGVWSTGHKIGKKGPSNRPIAEGHRCDTCKKIILSE